MNLNHYRRNVYSQFGEDGIIEEICRRLGMDTGWFVEFGAWDGKYLSNTFNLASNKGWGGVYIEGNTERYKDLLRTQAEFPSKLHTLCAMVGFEGENILDNLLAKTPLPREFELLSVDIDSCDWQVWNSLKDYRPKIVIIESNSLILPGKIEIYDPPTSPGSSFLALVKLGVDKGYQLVCHTGNCIFVLKELAPRLELDPELLAAPEKLFDYKQRRHEQIVRLGRKLLPERVMQHLFGLFHRFKRGQRA